IEDPMRRVRLVPLLPLLLLLLPLLPVGEVEASQIPNHLRVAQQALLGAPKQVQEIVGVEWSDTWIAYLAGAAALDGLEVRASAGLSELSGHNHRDIDRFLQNAYNL